MKLFSKSFSSVTGSNRGSAVIIIFAFIAIVGALAVSNNAVLANLQSELRLVEKRQLIHSGASSTTNAALGRIKSPRLLPK
jgi:hypothetical protein